MSDTRPRAFERQERTYNIWTDERIERLKELWNLGMSASQIAAKLGGTTRNSVIGKCHRLGLTRGRIWTPSVATPKTPQRTRADLAKLNQPKRIRVIGNTQTFAEPEAREPVRPASMRVFVPLEVCDPVPFGSPGCKWPVAGDGADLMCCGAKQKVRPDRDGLSPYCAHHHAVAFVPPKKSQSAGELRRMFRRYA